MITAETLRTNKSIKEKKMYNTFAKKHKNFVSNGMIIELYSNIKDEIKFNEDKFLTIFNQVTDFIVRQAERNKQYSKYIEFKNYEIDKSICIDYLTYFYKKYENLLIQNQIIDTLTLSMNCLVFFDCDKNFIGLILKQN